MKKEQMVDRVIGLKYCIDCRYPVSVESYCIKDAQARLDQHRCCCSVNKFGDPCGSTNFTLPEINVIMRSKR